MLQAFVSLQHIPHPIITITNLCIHGMYTRTHVCVCIHFRNFKNLPISSL